MARVLMVDDDREFIEASKSVLEAEGYTVFMAGGVDEAEGLLKKEKFDLIFLDIMMEYPDDGIVFAHKLKKQGLETPVIMLSAVSKVTGYKYDKCSEVVPCSDFLEKPVRPKELIAKAKKYIAKE